MAGEEKSEGSRMWSLFSHFAGDFVSITLSYHWSRKSGTIRIDSEMITVAKYPANMMISYDILVRGVIDRYSCHYSSQYLVPVFDSQDKFV